MMFGFAVQSAFCFFLFNLRKNGNSENGNQNIPYFTQLFNAGQSLEASGWAGRASAGVGAGVGQHGASNMAVEQALFTSPNNLAILWQQKLRTFSYFPHQALLRIDLHGPVWTHTHTRFCFDLFCTERLLPRCDLGTLNIVNHYGTMLLVFFLVLYVCGDTMYRDGKMS